MSLYIPKMSDTPGVTIPGLADNFGLLDGSQIVEQGSNENGRYVRWENGLQVCWDAFSDTRSTTTVTGPLYRDDAATMWTFPAAFIGEPIVCGSVSRGDDNYRLFFAPHSVTTTSVTYRDVATGSSATLGRSDRLLALGRWK